MKNQNIVCHTHSNMPRGCGYVMLSRATKIDNVFLADQFDLSKLQPILESLKMTKLLAENCMAAKLKQEKFDVFYVNLCGKKHFTDVFYDLRANQSSIVCLVETWLKPGETVFWPEENGNYVFLPPASMGAGKGVAAFVNKDTQKMNYFLSGVMEERFQILQLSVKDKYQLIILYISKGANFSEVATEIQNIVNLHKHLEPIVIGDFNIDVLQKNSLANFLRETLKLVQINTGPTYWRGPNCIDQCWVPAQLKPYLHSMFNVYSDHVLISLCLQ